MSETQNNTQMEVDPWEAAFAAVNKENKEDPEDTPDTGNDITGNGTPEEDNGSADTNEDETGNNVPVENISGGTGVAEGDDGIPDGYNSVFNVQQEDIDSYRESLEKSIEEQTLQDVANAYIKQGARNTNGMLGATINDPDICKRDEDGVPHFFNPDTGREFNGDNPRRQAQEWVDDYNRELANAFNETCKGYSKKLLEEQSHSLAVLEFAPKYEKLDDIRRSMFDSIIEDYEIKDNSGNVVGYSCDLDAALNTVNRQIRIIQERYRSVAPTKKDPSGPALDMKSTTKTDNGNARPEFKSVAEAMEWQQDQLLAKMKGNK